MSEREILLKKWAILTKEFESKISLFNMPELIALTANHKELLLEEYVPDFGTATIEKVEFFTICYCMYLKGLSDVFDCIIKRQGGNI